VNTQARAIGRTLTAAVVIGSLALPRTDAGSGHGGGGARAPRVSQSRGYKPPRMPRTMAPAHSNMVHGGGSSAMHPYGSNGTAAARTANAGINRANATNAGINRATSANARLSSSGTLNRSTSASLLAPNTTATLGTTRSFGAGMMPSGYTYGYGAGARSYRPYGYGTGYRNRYYGGNYGYGRSQGYSRAIVGRLRSVHASLARLDHDYQGHRVRAMHSISMAIRQLSHRSMVYSGTGFSGGMNNGRGMGTGMGMGRMGMNRGAGGRGGQRMSQAQSDARMSQALRALQGIGMQLNSQGSSTMGQGRASGHVQYAVHELSVALRIR
jgi:hypothetical protein